MNGDGTGTAPPQRTRQVLILARGGAVYGSQRQLGYLVAGMDRSRYRAVVVLDRRGPTTDLLRRAGAEVHVVRMRPWRSFPAGLLRYLDAWRIARLGRRCGACLVHASDPFRSGYLHFVARKLGVPSVVHVRGRVPPERIEGHALAEADAVVTIARRYREDLLMAGLPAERVEVIDDAVDLRQFHPDPAGREFLRQRLGVSADVLVGLVGRIEPSKRVREFLAAVALVPGAVRARAAFLILGQPKHQDYLETVQEDAACLGLRERVVLAGHISDMPRAMASLDVLATMSGGSVMFEAMACAKPVLSARTDGRHSEHTRHDETAWCVTTDRPGPVAEALAKLIEDAPLRTRLGLAARAWAERRLAPEGLALQTQALYDRLLGK